MPWMGMFIGGRPTPNLTPALPNFRTFSPRTTRLGMVTHLDNSPGFMVDAFAAKGGAPSPPYFNDPLHMSTGCDTERATKFCMVIKLVERKFSI